IVESGWLGEFRFQIWRVSGSRPDFTKDPTRTPAWCKLYPSVLNTLGVVSITHVPIGFRAHKPWCGNLEPGCWLRCGSLQLRPLIKITSQNSLRKASKRNITTGFILYI
ncbi:hypothetical protein AVEN_206134-1, partial [Araneus ventricosus]